MLKLAAVVLAVSTVAAVSISVVKHTPATSRDAGDPERLAGMPACDEVIVTAERPDWLIEEVVSVAKKPALTPDDNNLQSPWLYETEVAGQSRLPDAVN